MNAAINPSQFTTITERQANALDEIRQLHADHADLLRKTEEDRRTIERLQDRVILLNSDLRTAQQESKIYQRKLIRLAGAMSSMSRLAADADEIMRSVVDWVDETEEETKAEDESAKGIVAGLPPREEHELA